MTDTNAIDVYYDPFNFEIDNDPYAAWKRLRDEAPLYYNEKYNFYALSRYQDVARELTNWETYRSGKGTVLDIILTGVEVPPGRHPFRGSTASRSAPPAIVAGVHTAAHGGD